MAHIGLQPQSVATLGGYRAQGADSAIADQLRRDVLAVAAAGSYAVVIEGVVESLARELSAIVDIPTIGIGASSACDGQVLVTDDMLGLFSDFTPRFVKNLHNVIDTAAQNYAQEVRERKFPQAQHCFGTAPSLRKTGSK